jgi:hypothetical protein
MMILHNKCAPGTSNSSAKSPGPRGRRIAAAVLLYLGLMTGTGRAGQIVFGEGQVNPHINIGHYHYVGASTTQVIGEKNGTGPELVKVTTDTPLLIQGGGQAFLQAASTRFSQVIFDPFGTISGFAGIDFNPENRKGDHGTATFTLTATDQLGHTFTSGPFTLSNGNNRVFALAQGAGEEIKELVMNVSGADKGSYVYDIKQVRIQPGVDPPSAPEPSSLLMGAMGLGTRGLVGYLRRRSK